MPRCAQCDQVYADDYDGCPYCARPDAPQTQATQTQLPNSGTTSGRKRGSLAFILALFAVLLVAVVVALPLYSRAVNDAYRQGYTAGENAGEKAGKSKAEKAAGDTEASVRRIMRDSLISSLGYDLESGKYYIVKLKDAEKPTTAFKLQITSCSQPLMEDKRYEVRDDGIWSSTGY